MDIYLKKKVKWTLNDISQAFTLRYLGGVREYKYEVSSMNFPLPGLSTLRSWASKGCTKPYESSF